MSTPEPLVIVDRVSHYYGSGALRKQILFEVSLEIAPGEIIILTGPSGSGKTTLLTLIGGLRSAQEGNLTILGHALRGAKEATLVRARREIGYIFQLHNLLDALTVLQNVLTGLRDARVSMSDARERSREMLRAVGLEEHVNKFADQLSGGQKQRVAIARALVGRPRIVLADEPTASLDKKSGRDVVELLQQLAKQQGTAVVLVTHDNRILDVADRIVHLEEGKLTGLAEAVLANTQNLLASLAKQQQGDELLRQVKEMSAVQFGQLIERMTGEAQQLLQTLGMSTDAAFEGMLDRVLDIFTSKMGQLVDADRATLFLADPAQGELWSKMAEAPGEPRLEIRTPIGTGVAGHVYSTGHALRLDDAYGSSLFNPEIDRRTGYKTRSLLCAPLVNRTGQPFAVIQLLNKREGGAFDGKDEAALLQFASSMGAILETWQRAAILRRAQEVERKAASGDSEVGRFQST